VEAVGTVYYKPEMTLMMMILVSVVTRISVLMTIFQVDCGLAGSAEFFFFQLF